MLDKSQPSVLNFEISKYTTFEMLLFEIHSKIYI